MDWVDMEGGYVPIACVYGSAWVVTMSERASEQARLFVCIAVLSYERLVWMWIRREERR